MSDSLANPRRTQLAVWPKWRPADEEPAKDDQPTHEAAAEHDEAAQ